MKKLCYFVVFCVFFCVFSTFFMQNTLFADYCDKLDLVEYSGEIKHVFTHCLLADPTLALSSKNPMSKDYARDCITKDEFKSILHFLHKNNYILINPHNLSSNQNSHFEKVLSKVFSKVSNGIFLINNVVVKWFHILSKLTFILSK